MRTCSIHRWRWVCSDDLCWNASMDASRWCHRSSYPRTMTRLRGKFLLARACNSSTSRFLSELIFPLFSSDFFFMIQRVICIIQETKKIFFLMTLLDWLISCICNLIYNETDFAKFLDYRQHLVVMSIVVRCEASIIGDSLARGHWDPSVHNPSVCRTFSVITWDNPFPDFFCLLGMIC